MSLDIGEAALSRATRTIGIGEAVPETRRPPKRIGEHSLRHADRVLLGALSTLGPGQRIPGRGGLSQALLRTRLGSTEEAHRFGEAELGIGDLSLRIAQVTLEIAAGANQIAEPTLEIGELTIGGAEEAHRFQESSQANRRRVHELAHPMR